MQRIIGCGNLERGDDAAGLLVVRRLRALGMDAEEHAGDGLALIERWQGCDTVILIDTVVTGGAPGTVSVWEGREVPVAADVCRGSTHAFGVAEAVKLARALDRMPARLWIYGIEGRQFELGTAPSSEVLAAAERLAQRLAVTCEAGTLPPACSRARL
ncbi:MAG: hydrogenase maturation protease [Bryobacteraceae bacterium]